MKKFTPLWLTVMVAVLYLLHQDFWNWKKIEPLFLGFLPIGLTYHAAYALLASVMMAVLVKFAWPKALDELEAEDAAAPPAPQDSGQR